MSASEQEKIKQKKNKKEELKQMNRKGKRRKNMQKEQKCGCDHNRINKAINPVGQEKQNCRNCQRAREPEHQAIGQKIRKGKQKFVEIAAVNFKRRLHTDDHGQRKRRQQNGQNTIFSRS